MGSDLSRVCFALPTKYISIHAPRVGSDILRYIIPCSPYVFQSTLPVWGATKFPIKFKIMKIFQSTLPVWGATVEIVDSYLSFKVISIHAPRVGSDYRVGGLFGFIIISIHAPRVGSDLGNDIKTSGTDHFNPRSPCGERREADFIECVAWHFNPRSPCGERPISGRW